MYKNGDKVSNFVGIYPRQSPFCAFFRFVFTCLSPSNLFLLALYLYLKIWLSQHALTQSYTYVAFPLFLFSVYCDDVLALDDGLFLLHENEWYN